MSRNAEAAPVSRMFTPESVRTLHSLPRERRHSPEKEPAPIIFVASESRRRADFIQAMFELDERPVALKPGIELNDQDYGIPIVVKKNNDAIRQLPSGVLDGRRAKVILFASDVRTRICGVENGVSITKAKIKPKDIDRARKEVFADMTRASRETNANPYYYLDVATEVVTLKGTGEISRLPIPHTTVIELDPERIAYIAEPRGFDIYRQEIQAIIDSPYHLPNGDPPMGNIAGLVDFLALLRMDAVESIGQTATAKELAEVERRQLAKTEKRQANRQIRKGEAGFEEAAQGATFDAIISYIPTALRPLISDIGQRVMNYQPIQRLNRFGLREIA